MESLCVSLETSRKLRDAGFPQETVYGWNDTKGLKHEWELNSPWRGNIVQSIAAPTSQELADQLPVFTLYRNTDQAAERYLAASDNEGSFDETGDGPNLAEALANLWLALAEQKKGDQ